jgi:hypothetical protein
MDEVEVIEIIEDGEKVFHLKPQNDKYKFYPVRKIPADLFTRYIQERSQYRHTRGMIKRYFRLPKDKLMRVERNHVKENEVHKFNDDGSITIKPNG